MAELPPPPPGFEIDPSSIPPPPPGFKLEGASVALRKDAAEPARAPEGFFETLVTELSAGHQAMSNGTSPGATGQPADITPGLHQMTGLNQMLLAPLTAGSRAMGQGAQDISMAIGSKLGLSPDINANLGAIIGASTDVIGNLAAVPKLLSSVSPYVRTGVQEIMKRLPGSQVALREMGKADIGKVMDTLNNQGAKATDLYKVVETLNPKVTTPEFNALANKILKQQQKLNEFNLGSPSVSSVAAGAKRGTVEAVDPAGKWLGDTFGQDPRTQLKEIPFSLIADVRQALGAHIGELRQTGGKDLGSFKLLYGALSRDLENSANRGAGAAYAALNHANATAKKEFAVGELDEIFRGTMGKALEGQEFTSSNFAQALNKIRKERIDNELFEQGLGKKTLDSIEARLDEFRRLKINPPPKGVNVGSALVATRMGVGGGVGSFFGPVGTATGVLAAAIGPPAISAIMRSDTGSKALKDILQRRGSVSPEHFRAVIALSLANPDGKRDIRSEVSSVLKSADMSIEEKMQAIMSGEAKLTEIQGANDLLKQ